MKTVKVNATAGRVDDDVVARFTGGSSKVTFKGEVVHFSLGQLTMPADVWELFKAALMTLHRSRTEDYYFETGLRYEQPKDGKEYPEQHCLEIDVSILDEEGLRMVRMGDMQNKAEASRPEPEEPKSEELTHVMCPRCGNIGGEYLCTNGYHCARCYKKDHLYIRPVSISPDIAKVVMKAEHKKEMDWQQ